MNEIRDSNIQYLKLGWTPLMTIYPLLGTLGNLITQKNTYYMDFWTNQSFLWKYIAPYSMPCQKRFRKVILSQLLKPKDIEEKVKFFLFVKTVNDTNASCNCMQHLFNLLIKFQVSWKCTTTDEKRSCWNVKNWASLL